MAATKAFGRISYGGNYSRPEPMGEWERGFVEQKRAVRASWDDIAKMLNRSVEDVRRKFDREWSDPVRPAIRIARVDLGLREQQARALEGLILNETLTREHLATLLYGREAASAVASTLSAVVSLLRSNLEKRGVSGLSSVHGVGWKLTPQARERLAELGWSANG
jgi:hypothetical protein